MNLAADVPDLLERALEDIAQSRLAAAEARCREILQIEPRCADAVHLLAVVAHRVGRRDLARSLVAQAIELQPTHPAYHNTRAAVCNACGDPAGAVAASREALRLMPQCAEAMANLGDALRRLGDVDGALAACRAAIEWKPALAEAWRSLGDTLREKGEVESAIEAYDNALHREPGNTVAAINRANARRELGDLAGAIEGMRRVLEIEPRSAIAWTNLGFSLSQAGDAAGAVDALRNSLGIDPGNPAVRSNLILHLHFLPETTPESLARECSQWNARHAHPLPALDSSFSQRPDPKRPLRIGWVSPDFRDHVLGRNLLPLFTHRDRDPFEYFCYSEVLRPDSTTARFRELSDHWRDTRRTTDTALEEQIRADGIDVLLDLTLHADGNRLPVFARRPAPVQASFAGYPGDTGVEAIAFRISDPFLESGGVLAPGRVPEFCLLDSFWCYQPPEAALDPGDPPFRANGHVTFGCLHTCCKMNAPMLRRWAAVLDGVGNARMLILTPPAADREKMRAEFGGAASRVAFADTRAHREYLELYRSVDVVLDTFPYQGHTTSLEALWMGVPVVSLCGPLPISRAALSQLSNLGLPELVAHSEGDFVMIACELARDADRLHELRATLRHRMEASVLMDAPRFARGIERALRGMWRQWCEGEGRRA